MKLIGIWRVLSESSETAFPVIASAIGRAFLLLLLIASMSPAHAQERRPIVTSHQAAAASLLEYAGSDAEGHARLRVDPAALAELRTAPSGSTGGAMLLPLRITPDRTLDLLVTRMEAAAPSASFVRADADGVETALLTPDVLLLRGSVAGQPGSHVFFALTQRGGGSGLIREGDGRIYRVQSLVDADAGGSLIVVRPGAGSALPDMPTFCGMEDLYAGDRGGACCPPPEHVGAPGPLAGGTGPAPSAYRGSRLLRIAIEGDRKFVELFPTVDDAAAYVLQVIAAVSTVFERDLSMRIVVDRVRLWPDGNMPFGANNLSGFRNWWLENERMDGINLVHLFSGRRDLNYGGVAYLASACNQNAFGISGFLLGDFPDPLQASHLGNWDVMVVAHEIGHNLSARHTHDYDIDACASGDPVRGTIMSYCHINQGGLLNTELHMHTFVADVIAQTHPHGEAGCLAYDCNGNGIDDALDIAEGRSVDLDGNGIPDECEDCTGTGILHSVLIAGGAADVNGNGIPDICEPDCTGSGIPDSWEIAMGLVNDRNGNGIPDICEPDCDGNGVPDFLDILHGTHEDIDRDGVPDLCQDCTGNGLPDWIDLERQFHLFIGLADGAVREYHRDSGVFMQTLGEGVIHGSYDLAFAEDRLLYVASFFTDEIIRVDPDSGGTEVFVAAGSGGLSGPVSLLFAPDGNLLVLSRQTASVLEYDGHSGAFLREFIPAGSGGLTLPWTMRFHPAGQLLISSGNDRILRFSAANGHFLGIFADWLRGISDPRGLAVLPGGDVLIVNHGTSTVRHHRANGAFLRNFSDDYPVTDPWGITVGPSGSVFFARNTTPVRLLEYDAGPGRLLRSFVRGDEDLILPTNVAFRPASALDSNGSGVPDACEMALPGDFNADGVVDEQDLSILLSAWGLCPQQGHCPADLNGDAAVNLADLLIFLAIWNG